MKNSNDAAATAPLVAGTVLDQQARLERLSVQMGKHRSQERYDKLVESKQAHLLPPIQRMIASWRDPLARIITDTHREYMKPKPVNQNARLYAPILDDLKAERVAGVVLTTAISRLMVPQVHQKGYHHGWPQGCSWQAIASNVGKAVYAEWQTTILEEMPWVDRNGMDTDRDMMWLLRRRWKTLDANKIGIWLKRNSKNPIDIDETIVTTQMGGDLVHMLSWAALFDEDKKAVHAVTMQVGRKQVKWVFLDPVIVGAVDDAMAKIAVTKPVALPCVVEPLRLSTENGCGYHHNKNKLVYRMSGRQREKLKATEGAEFWDGLNLIQSTELTICARTKEVQEQCIAEGGGVMGIPRMNEMPELPRLPDELSKDKERLIDWIRTKRKIHEDNINIRGPRRQMSSLMQAASMMAGFEKFWIPVRLDFRGRQYAGTPSLSYSASDVHRGLLLMGEAKEPGPRGEWWKLVHAANCYGHDKLPFDERAAWAKDHIPNMVRAATLGLDDDWWQQAKKPWQFFTACVSFVDRSVAARIMAGIDHSCSGLQHYAAMGLDEDGGRMVNLLPSDKPNDAYLTVLAKILPIVERDAAEGKTMETKYGKVRAVDDRTVHRDATGKVVHVAKLVLPLLKGKNARDFPKQPTMTFSYGVTMNGVRSQIKWRLIEHGISQEDAGPCTIYLADVIMRALKESTGKASQIMQWFKDSADCVVRRVVGMDAARKEPTTQTVELISPSGFPMVQPYWKSRRVEINTLAGVMNVHVPDETGVVDPVESVRGIAPNTIHMFDAALLHRTAAQCGMMKVSLVPIHDDFNSHLCSMDTLGQVNRASFISIYRENVLANLHAQFQAIANRRVPDPPERGSLDLDRVADSLYFCH